MIFKIIECNYCDRKFDNHKSMTNHRRWHNSIFRNKASKNIGNAKLGNKNPMWKGDNVGYSALHDYIKFHFPKTDLCQCCNLSPAYDLANISGKYKRDFSDWEWLCRRCHMSKDGRLKNIIERDRLFNKTKKFCPYGHEYTEENTLFYRNQRGCRSCIRIRQLKYYHAKKYKNAV